MVKIRLVQLNIEIMDYERLFRTVIRFSVTKSVREAKTIVLARFADFRPPLPLPLQLTASASLVLA